MSRGSSDAHSFPLALRHCVLIVGPPLSLCVSVCLHVLQVHVIATAVQSNTSLLEFRMGDQSKVDEAAVSIILATLSLNRLVRELLSRAGFQEHVRRASHIPH